MSDLEHLKPGTSCEVACLMVRGHFPIPMNLALTLSFRETPVETVPHALTSSQIPNQRCDSCSVFTAPTLPLVVLQSVMSYCGNSHSHYLAQGSMLTR